MATFGAMPSRIHPPILAEHDFYCHACQKAGVGASLSTPAFLPVTFRLPAGWWAVDLEDFEDGVELTTFVCSEACARKLAHAEVKS